MDIRLVIPVYWSTDELVGHGEEVVHDLLVRTASTLTNHRLLLGRGLEAVRRLESFRQRGFANPCHYAAVVLHIDRREAREAMRVANALDNLPVLRREAEEGSLGWSYLREVVRKASPRTETFWLQLCRRQTTNEIAVLIGKTLYDEFPDMRTEPTEEDKGDKSELRCFLSPVSLAILDRGLQALSVELKRPVTLPQALERLFAERVAKGPIDEQSLEKVRAEARKDIQAKDARLHRLVVDARMLAEEMGLLEEQSYGAEMVDDWADEDELGRAHGFDQEAGTEDRSEDPKGAERNCGLQMVDDSERDNDDRTGAGHKDAELENGRHEDGTPEGGEKARTSGEQCSLANTRTNASSSSATPDSGRETDRNEPEKYGDFLIKSPRQLQKESRERPARVILDESVEEQTFAGSSSAKDKRNEKQRSDSLEDARVFGSQDPYATVVNPRRSDWGAPVESESKILPYHPIFAAGTVPSATCDTITPAKEPAFPRLDHEAAEWRNTRLQYNALARGVTPAQRRDLLRRDGHCCRVPGCTNRVWLELHHLLEYCYGGPTSSKNLVLVCTQCHKNYHLGFLKITGSPEDGTLTFTDANGRPLDRHTPLVRASWLDYHFGWSGKSWESRWGKVAAETIGSPAAIEARRRDNLAA